jgi:plasmid stabilization system protein ParE
VQIRVHAGAAADLGSAGDWYELQVPGLARDLTDEVDRALDAIAERPSTWPLWPGVDPALGVRRFLLPRFPFAIAYLVEGDTIIVLAVAHLRRRPGYWLRRASGSR